jgi:hypothetical protein
MDPGLSWLVVCSTEDEPALWAYDRIRERSSAPVELVTDADLAGAVWDHRVGEHGVSTEIRLPDGRIVLSDSIGATLDRLVFVPTNVTAQLAAPDREYGYSEFSALLLSWLAGLTGPVLDPPTTRGLGGAWRSPGEWALVAAEVGLGCVPISTDSASIDDGEWRAVTGWPSTDQASWIDWRPYLAIPEDAIVVGEVVFSERDPDDRRVGDLRQPSQGIASHLIEVALAWADDRSSTGPATRSSARIADGSPRLRGVTPMPDLRAAGEQLIDALVDQFERPA